MTTADQLAIVNRLLQAPAEAYTLAQAGLVVEFAKHRRLLVLARCSSEQALLVLISQSYPVAKQSDLSIEKALPINSGFRFEIGSSSSSPAPNSVLINVTADKQKFLFEMLPGYHTQNFVSEMYRVTDGLAKRAESVTSFAWLTKYQSDPQLTADSSKMSGSSSTLASDDADAAMPGTDMVQATTLVRDRESVANYQMSTREEEFTDIRPFTLFVGTWNVNGQSPGKENLSQWLAVDEKPPDLYAIGFQELDLSKEAFVFLESVKEEEWMRAVGRHLHPGASYSLVRHVRLVGMLLIVYARVELIDQISNLAVDTVGTGIMGKLGNKGGVGIRLRFHATDLCFVNSHLAAHVEEYERRNQDYTDICARMVFSSAFERPCSESVPLGALRIRDHESVFWLGDLNYRLSGLDTAEVKEYLKDNNLEILRSCDQFVQQRHQRKVFIGYKEGEIAFQPTYKYDTGTNTWDSSEKARPPAWTDRILWLGDRIQQTAYRSHMELMVSDHKPVSSLFNIGIKVIDRTKRQKIKEEIMKKLDMLENDFLPQVMVDSTDILFDTIQFLEPAYRTLAIANTGQVPVQFEFIRKPGEERFCRPWLILEPSSGFIMQGQKVEVKLEIYVDKKTAHTLNSGKDMLYDILVLHLLGGKDIFITVSATYIKSSFGCSIDSLVRLKVPVAELSPGQMVSLEAGEMDKLPASAVNNSEEGYQVPKELWFLCDMMISLGLGQEQLFLSPGIRHEILAIRDWLDTGLPADRPKVSIHSVAEALLVFLESLREPIIPSSFYNRCLECSGNYLQCKQIISQLPVNHRNAFQYLTGFLKEVLQQSMSNGVDPKILATLFCSIFLRDSSGKVAGARNKISQQLVERKKTSFIYHFLAPQADA